MKNKAIVFDLDGTAVDSPREKLPSKRLVEVVDKLKEKYYLCSATGRVWHYAKSVLHNLKLVDPCIISSGTQICNPVNGEILWQCDIVPSDLKRVEKIFDKFPDFGILANDYSELDYLSGGSTFITFKWPAQAYFLERVFVPEIEALQMMQKLSSISGLTSLSLISQKRSDHRDIHIVNSGATKEHAIVELLQMMGVEKCNAVGIGDGYNDLRLFNGVGYGVAMEILCRN